METRETGEERDRPELERGIEDVNPTLNPVKTDIEKLKPQRTNEKAKKKKKGQ